MGQLKINSRAFVDDVRSGLTEPDLMEKYGLSEKQLSTVFEKLLDAGLLHSGDLEHQPQFEATVVVASTCVACGALKFVDSGACPQCGMINPGTTSTATTLVGQPSSLVEGIKSRMPGEEEPTTTIQSPDKGTAFEPASESPNGRPSEKLPTEKEVGGEPLTEQQGTSLKMWSEPHEDLLPSDEELWAGGPDIELTGLAETTLVRNSKSRHENSPPRDSGSVESVTNTDDGPEENLPSKRDRASEDEEDATELLPVLQEEDPQPGVATGARSRVIGLAACLAILAAIGGVGFFFFDDIETLFSGDGPSPPAQFAQVKRTPPPPKPQVEESRQPVQPPAPAAVAIKAEQIDQGKAEIPSVPLKEAPLEVQLGEDKEMTAVSSHVPTSSSRKLPEPQQPAELQTLKTVAQSSNKVDTTPKSVPEEVELKKAEPTEQPKSEASVLAKSAPERVVLTDPNAELITAIDNEEVKRARALLSSGADPNATDLTGVNALIRAVKAGNDSLVRLLIEGGAEIARKGPDGQSALDWALQTQDARIARVILSHSGDGGAAELIEASRKGDRDTIGLLLEGGANINSTGEMGETALMVAASAGHIGVLKFLLDKGADPRLADKKGVNALGWARSPAPSNAVPWRVQREVVQLLKRYINR